MAGMLTLETPITKRPTYRQNGLPVFPLLRLITDAAYRPQSMALGATHDLHGLRRPADARYPLVRAESLVQPTWLGRAVRMTIPHDIEYRDPLNNDAIRALRRLTEELGAPFKPGRMRFDAILDAFSEDDVWVAPVDRAFVTLGAELGDEPSIFERVPAHLVVAAGLRFVAAHTMYASAVDI
ncbi:MAG TPA: hypothetical protein VLH84_05015 [Patescibacteria group bacterium]|nr:hypothetical protein [Patescibacteria group bacterium]